MHGLQIGNLIGWGKIHNPIMCVTNLASTETMLLGPWRQYLTLPLMDGLDPDAASLDADTHPTPVPFSFRLIMLWHIQLM